MAGNTHNGWVPDTDTRYSGGSTIIAGPNLNPHFVNKLKAQQGKELAKKPAKAAKAGKPQED